MLPLIALVLVVALVALAGGGVVWMVLAGVIAPEVAAGGSSIVLIGSFVALGMLVVRIKARRTERDIHTIRRSQAVRERQPLRYELSEEPRDGPSEEPPLVRSLPPVAPPPAASRERDASSTAATEAPDDAALALWLEPIVAMPRNETDAWRAMAGDGERPIPTDALPPVERARVQLWTIRAAMRLVGTLDGPILCRIDGALLGDRDAGMELRRIMGDEPAAATRIVLVADLDALDVLASGRLDDLIDEGVGLALDAPDLDGLDRAGATRAAERGAGMALLPDDMLDRAMAPRPVRLLREAGIEPVGVDVPDEDAMLALADLGIMRFAGTAFGAPRRARALAARSAGNVLPPASGDAPRESLPDRPKEVGREEEREVAPAGNARD